MKVPTFNELISIYREIACIERAKCGIPCEGTVRNVIAGVKYVVGDKIDNPVTCLSRRQIDDYMLDALKRNMSPVTVWGYVGQLRSITARWTRPYYKDRDIRVPRFELPCRKKKSPRYIRPAKAKLAKVKGWYESLATRTDKRLHIAATLMLEFAMRNGDIARLEWGAFLTKGSHVHLCYTPHKTVLSSGRTVSWPVHEDIWNEFRLYQEQYGQADSSLVVPHASWVFRKLNAELRELGFKGSKGLYELRKICIDHVYQKFGAEMASSISGDDIRTVTRYYADPSVVNMVGVRVVDLL